jgi:SAM-dependent methyltransferase
LKEAGKSYSSIRDIAEDGEITIYDTNFNGPISWVLYDYALHYSSFFSPTTVPGTQITPLISCQDLQALTFSNDSFDLVITEDVLEHVKDYKRAVAEIRRVLKLGGKHIFTVPFLRDQETLIRVDGKGEQEVHLEPPEYHLDSEGESLTYRTFGTDLLDTLSSSGFETEIDHSCYSDQKAGIFDSYVFISRRVE